MPHSNCPIILRKPEVLNRTGFSRSTLHARIKQRLFPKPVSLGARAVGWPESEVSALISALIAGKSKEGVSELVEQLERSRAEAAL